jgi:hypothetical protein
LEGTPASCNFAQRTKKKKNEHLSFDPPLTFGAHVWTCHIHNTTMATAIR